MKHVVYSITINDTIRYIGKTTIERIDIREKEHNSSFKKGDKKQLYDYLRKINFSGELKLEPIYLCKTKLEAKQYECYTILYFRFNFFKQLQQKTPNISDF